MSKRNGNVVFADRNGMGAGKGACPRNNSSQQFRDNFDKIDWSNNSTTTKETEK